MDSKLIRSKKRRHAETEECKHPQLDTRPTRNVRRKISPGSRSNSSRSSTPSVSEASALFSTDLSSSTRDAEDDSDTETSLSSSSEDTSSGSDSDEDDTDMESTSGDETYESDSEIETLRVGSKPSIRPAVLQETADVGQPPLLERLKGFLPRLAAANQSLDEERAAGILIDRDLEAVNEEDGEGYIEMNLGLGVLEEKDPTAESSSSGDDSSDDEDEQGGAATREKDVIGNLMGQKRRGGGAHIQEVGNG